jgi:hypothetical protein
LFLDLETIRENCNAHIVGQVDDNVLLFTWDGKTDDTTKVTLLKEENYALGSNAKFLAYFLTICV